MSIEAKHAYRFGYLQSDEWKTVRLEALAREKGKCQICGHESIFNDAHHIWYPKDVYETKERQLVILCRDCHEFLHAVGPDCKTQNEDQGRANWASFHAAVGAWVAAKRQLFTAGPRTIRDLRRAYEELKAEKREIGRMQTVIDAARGLAVAISEFEKIVDKSREE